VGSGFSGDIRVYNFVDISGKCTKVMKGHNSYVKGFLLSEDFSILFSCSDDKKIKMWKL